jgi:hypothetical protein
MSCNPWGLDPRTSFTGAIALPLCLALSACGGGGGGTDVASIPPPPVTPTPTPTPPPPPASNALMTTIGGYTLVNSLDVQTSWLESPATRDGKYDLIGRLTLTPQNGDPSSYRAVLPGEFTMATNLYFGRDSGDFPSYSLTAPAGVLPGGLTSLGPATIAGSWDINQSVAYFYGNPYESQLQAVGQRLTAFDKAQDGSETKLFSYDFTRGTTSATTSLGSGKSLSATLDYDIGYSYVAMGEWSWRVVDLNGAAAGDSGDLLFVNGDRTPASGIPVSGTATYNAHTLALLSTNFTAGIPFTLTADFGQRTIATRIDQDYRYNAGAGLDGDPAVGIHVGGSAPFSNNGLFDIPLTGTANYSYNNAQVAPPTEAVTGDMNGAFFGPHAEQVGGAFSVERPSGALLLQDAFVGQQHP